MRGDSSQLGVGLAEVGLAQNGVPTLDRLGLAPRSHSGRTPILLRGSLACTSSRRPTPPGLSQIRAASGTDALVVSCQAPPRCNPRALVLGAHLPAVGTRPRWRTNATPPKAIQTVS